METIKNIAAIIGCILSTISLITLCTKGGRAFIHGFFKRNTKEIQDENERQTSDIQQIKKTLDLMLSKFAGLEEVSMQQCRDTIKTIYYKYHKDKRIPLYERKTADRTYQIYTTIFHGNSYAALLYKEICKWEIDTISYQDLIDEEWNNESFN